MKLLVLGATGGTGIEIVRQAIERGHSVTAFVRSPDKLLAFRDRISIQQGEVLNGAELERVIKGQDAVLSAFGPRLPISKADADLLRRFAVALRAAMQRAGVRRIVVESTAFLFKDSIIPPTYLFGRLFFRGIVLDALAMEKLLSGNGFELTVVRPPRLTDGPHTGKYRVRGGHLPRFGFSISRADVADFMVKAAESRSWAGKIAGVCN